MGHAAEGPGKDPLFRLFVRGVTMSALSLLARDLAK